MWRGRLRRPRVQPTFDPPHRGFSEPRYDRGISRFRRLRSGSTYFFTLVAYHRRRILCDDAIRAALRSGFERTRARHPITIDAIVLLPDHLHCIWTLPEDDLDISTRRAQIKHHVSWSCRGMYDDFTCTKTRNRRRESAIWQRRFYERMVKSELEMERYSDYIPYNPVKHGHVTSAQRGHTRRLHAMSERESIRLNGVESATTAALNSNEQRLAERVDGMAVHAT